MRCRCRRSVKYRSRAVGFATGLEGSADGACVAAATYDFNDDEELAYIDMLGTQPQNLGVGRRFVADLLAGLERVGAR